MPENLFEAQYDVTKKSKFKEFYDSNKILIFSSLVILIIIFSSFSFFLSNKEKKKILLSDNYVQAKIYLENGNKVEAINILKNVKGISFVEFDSNDVVRHALVKKIISAYSDSENSKEIKNV